jgi:hypothetical protein
MLLSQRDQQFIKWPCHFVRYRGRLCLPRVEVSTLQVMRCAAKTAIAFKRSRTLLAINYAAPLSASRH